MIFNVNKDYLLKRHWAVDLCNGKVLLRYELNSYLDVLRLQRVKCTSVSRWTEQKPCENANLSNHTQGCWVLWLTLRRQGLMLLLSPQCSSSAGALTSCSTSCKCMAMYRGPRRTSLWRLSSKAWRPSTPLPILSSTVCSLRPSAEH
jgi:hypothetical protein